MGWLTRSPSIEPPTKQFFVNLPSNPHTMTQTNQLGHEGMRFADGNTDAFTINFYVPDDFVTLQEVVLILQSLAAGDAWMDFLGSWGPGGASADETTDTVAAAAITLSANVITELDVSAALTGIAAGDYVGLFCQRTGGNVNDTINNHVECFGLMVRYS